jgi:DNA/RNA endonuclease YhcR with UshA esterase domain
MQDATGGLQVFDVTPGSGLQVGDNIRVTGLMGAFSGEQQIVRIDATTLPTVLLLGAGTPPTPRTVTAADIVARTYEGQLVTISDAVLGTIPGGTAAAYNLPFTAPPNVAFTVRIEAGVGATVTRGSWTSGATYSVTGVLGSFNGTAQLKPRGAGDIVFGAPPVLSIATAKARPAGDTVTVAGVVTVPQGAFRTQGDNIYLQDNTAGMQIFDVDPALALVVGDSVKITGLMGAFNGELQMVRFDVATRPTVVDLGGGTAITPRTITVADLVARTYEGELVQITDAVLTVIPSGTSASYNLTFDIGGTTFTGRIEAGVGATVTRATWTVGNTYTIVGVLGSFNGAAQLKPRGAGDITLQ